MTISIDVTIRSGHRSTPVEQFVLLGDKAIFLPGRKTLIVSDIHLGKAASFRARNFFAPEGITTHDLDRLSHLLASKAASRLLILGDLVHAQDGVTSHIEQAFVDFSARQDCQMVLVKGNHDVKVKIPSSWPLDLVEEHFTEDGIIFSHDLNLQKDLFTLCGHIHPAVVLSGKGRQRERLPCFWLRDRHMILPSFGVFTGASTVSPAKGDRVFVVAQGEVVEVKSST